MATAADAAAQGAEPGLENDAPADGVTPAAGAAPEAEADDEPEAIQQLARDMGWTPRDEYSGPPEQFRSATDFIRAGREIQRNTSNELKALRQTVETLTRTSASIAEQEIERRVEELSGRYTAAVEEGDSKAAFRLANEIGTLTAKARAPSGPGQPSPAAQDFASRNSAWFQKDALATATAVDICNRLAAQGYDEHTQLEAAEKEVRRLYPHIAGQNGAIVNGKPQAGVGAPRGRAPASNAGRAKGFADMPPEAQKVGEDMVARGVIKTDTPEQAKAIFAQNYWREAERKA